MTILLINTRVWSWYYNITDHPVVSWYDVARYLMCAASIRLLYTCIIVYVDMYNIKENYVHALLVLNDCSETHAIFKTGIVQYL